MFGGGAATLNDRLALVENVLDDLEIRYHDEQDRRLMIEVLGVEINGHTGFVRQLPRRAWRLHAGTSVLLSMKRGAGWQVRILVGHFICLAQLCTSRLLIYSASKLRIVVPCKDKETPCTSVMDTVGFESTLQAGFHNGGCRYLICVKFNQSMNIRNN